MQSEEMLAYKLVLSYDGTRFKGWQRGNGRTIQAVVEEAVGAALGTASGGRVRPEPSVPVVGSGRTDAGVHAEAQVASVYLSPAVNPDLLLSAVNRLLPEDVALLSCGIATSRFHARYNAKAKTYRYRIVDGPVGSPFLWRYSWRVQESLDEERMREAARALVGRYDCTSLTSDKSKKDRERTLHAVRISRKDGALELFFRGDGFLWNQVRILASLLVQAGKGEIDAAGIRSLIEARDRALAPPPAPAAGLCLIDVEY